MPVSARFRFISIFMSHEIITRFNIYVWSILITIVPGSGFVKNRNGRIRVSKVHVRVRVSLITVMIRVRLALWLGLRDTVMINTTQNL